METLIPQVKSRPTMLASERKTALFINGVYESVLEEIVASQNGRGPSANYLQPYKGSVIQMLKQNPPTPRSPVNLYLSTTKNLKNISYVAQITGWQDKRELTPDEKDLVLAHLRNHQPGEIGFFSEEEEVSDKAVNLLTIQDLRPCTSSLPTSILKKKSDELPLKPRTRAGGWSEVFDIGDMLMLPIQPIEDVENDLQDAIRKATNLSYEERSSRLKTAKRLPERIQLLSTGFRRNPDVIVEVLRRAAGICEKCRQPAPFLRRSDTTPFLEVHHWVPLSDGGEDTVENAGALCPNCHREAHFG